MLNGVSQNATGGILRYVHLMSTAEQIVDAERLGNREQLREGLAVFRQLPTTLALSEGDELDAAHLAFFGECQLPHVVAIFKRH